MKIYAYHNKHELVHFDSNYNTGMEQFIHWNS